MQLGNQHLPLINLWWWPQERLYLHFGRVSGLSQCQFLFETAPLLHRIRLIPIVNSPTLLLTGFLKTQSSMSHRLLLIGLLIVVGKVEGLLLLLEGLLELSCIEMDRNDIGVVS